MPVVPVSDLHRSLRTAGRQRTACAVSAQAVSYEREAELRLMADLLAGVGSSGGKVVLVRGEAGIGKSALVRDLVEKHGDEAFVLFGSCDDLLTPQPLGAFWEMAREETALSQPLEKGDRRAVMGILLDLLSRGPNGAGIEGSPTSPTSPSVIPR